MADPGSPSAAPPRRIDLVLSERIKSWVSGAREESLKEWRRRAAESFLVDGLPVLPPAPSTDLITETMASMTWLLTTCRDGVKATAVGYLPPTLVPEGADRFGWWPFPGQPRTEADLHKLHHPREISTRVGWLAKRSGRIRTTRSLIAASTTHS